MTSSYSPKLGTIPARVIEHLTATGGTMTRAAIANGFAIEPKNVDGNLATCIKHGLIVRHQVEGQKTCYGLPGSTPGEESPVPAAHLTMMRSPNSTLLPAKSVMDGILVTLQILATPEGVLMRADGDVTADNDAANVARVLCRFAEGLFVSGVNVQLDPAIVEAVL